MERLDGEGGWGLGGNEWSVDGGPKEGLRARMEGWMHGWMEGVRSVWRIRGRRGGWGSARRFRG